MDNRKKALAGVVSIEVWHAEFTKGRRTVNLHVDVTFKEGRIGAEAESPVTFRLNLMRAEIVAIVPENEPCEIPRNSVDRDSGYPKQLTVSTSEHERHTKQAKISKKPSVGKKHQETHGLRVSAKMSPLTITHSISEDGFHCWQVHDPIGETLRGKPWDASRQPRLKIKDTRRDASRGIPPSVRVQVRCRREDMKITDITRKKDTPLKNMIHGNRMAAAEAYIKEQLQLIEFDASGDIRLPFTEIVVADVFAENT